LTIKSTSHTTRRYFLLRLHTCVGNATFSTSRLSGRRSARCHLLYARQNIQLSKIDLS
jgi:hypothetical protein